MNQKELTARDYVKLNIICKKVYDENNDVNMNLRQCAEFLGKNINTIKVWCDTGKITANYVGSSWIIPKIQFLDKLLESYDKKLDNYGIQYKQAI